MNILQFLFIMTLGLFAVGALVTVTMFMYLVGPLLFILVIGWLLYEVLSGVME